MSTFDSTPPGPTRLRPHHAVVAAIGLNTLFAILLLGHNVPIGDDWHFVEDIRRYADHTLDVTFLMRQHNEHRIPFPRLVMLGSVVVSDWNLRHLMVASFVLASLTFLLLCVAHRRDFSGLDRSVAHSQCLTAALVFSIGQYQNWLWGWQVCIYINVLAVTTAFFLLSQARRGMWMVAGAAAMGVLASYSFGSGLLVWPVGLLLFRDRLARRGELALWLAAMAISMGAYFHGYQSPTHTPDPWYAARHPVQFATYVVTFIGGPVLYLSVGTKFLAGVLGLTLLAWTARVLSRDRALLHDRRLDFWLACGGYALGTAALVGAGRAGFGVSQAGEGRYLTIANLYWVMLIGVFSHLHRAGRLQAGRSVVLGYRVLWAGAVLTLITSTVVLYRTWPSSRLTWATQELRKERSDISAVKTVSRDVALVESAKPFLKERKLTYHAAP